MLGRIDSDGGRGENAEASRLEVVAMPVLGKVDFRVGELMSRGSWGICLGGGFWQIVFDGGMRMLVDNREIFLYNILGGECMRYDREELARRIADKREAFIKTTIMIILFMLAATVLLVIYRETTVTFICVVSILLSVALLAYVIKKNAPMILFSKEIRGINVKEHEYTTVGCTRNSRWFGRYTVGKVTKSNIHGIVYLRLDDGDVVAVDGHMQVHTDIYEIGDELVRYAGCRYLVVTDRDVAKNPCPLCGTVNNKDAEACRCCGLGIIK